MSSGFHIHAPMPTSFSTVRIHCPTCGKRRSMFVLTYEWYGPHMTCLACGEQWSDGEMVARPFARGWRAENIRKAKQTRRLWSAYKRKAGGRHKAR